MRKDRKKIRIIMSGRGKGGYINRRKGKACKIFALLMISNWFLIHSEEALMKVVLHEYPIIMIE